MSSDYNEKALEYYRRLRQTMRTKRSTCVGLAEAELTVKYHDTVVFTYYVDTGDVFLNTGGWYIYTTKDRLNECCRICDIPVSVYQETRRKRADDPPWADAEYRRKWWVHLRPRDQRYVLDGKLHFNRSHCFPAKVTA